MTGIQKLLATLVLAMADWPALAQDYPARPLQFVVAFAPGGAGDLVARLVAKKLAEGLHQAVVVDNRPVPVSAVSAVAHAKPDGHTLLMAGSGTALTTALFKTLPYDLMKDFTHVSTLASFDLALITSATSSFRSVADVLAWARAHPGQLTIGTVRLGSTQNLTAEMFKAAAGVDALIVPYKTTGEILTALRAGDVQLAVEILPAVLGPVANQSVRPLAVTAARRFPGWAGVPTLAESGLPGFEASSWNGVAVPAGTPPAVVDRLARELAQVLAAPDVQKQLQALGAVGRASTPQQMAERMQADIAKWQAVIAKAGIARQ